MAKNKPAEEIPVVPGQTLKVLELPLSSLRIDPKNVRKHSERNIGVIMASITDHGQVEPILVQAKTRRVIAGHGRLEALGRLGYKTAQVVELDCDAKTAKLLGIRLNKSAELGEWDYQGLSEIFSSLNPEDQLRTGFADFEIEPLLNADWAPPAIDDKTFERGEEGEAVETPPLPGELVLRLNKKQAKVFQKAQEQHGEEDPIVFLMGLCQSALE